MVEDSLGDWILKLYIHESKSISEITSASVQDIEEVIDVYRL